MKSPSYVTKSITVCGADGNHIRVSETAERQEVVIGIQQNDDGGRLATVRLNHEQFEAFCNSKYDLEVLPPASPKAE